MQTDSKTLETISLILSAFKTDKNPSLGDYTWAIEMIKYEVIQTGRTV
jgi:hypothetical protein